ncbi:hypothetical protein [Nostoc sp. UIC 10630]|uniref:hypothetical protein n=1 Tax=Nostoc sp. UIC 10630 TaxID=2100146 RepID=UPI0013D4914D|nr:hypothetical protein [Nostoc sp. UIC 10630]NEU82841.1 hypothetical protein [Nostoc sp. UIC 10630]
MQILLVSDRIATFSRHPLSPLRHIDKQLSNICHLHILKLQHHAATLNTLAQRNNCIAHLLQQRWRCFARLKSDRQP